MAKQDCTFDFEFGKYKGRGWIGIIALGMVIIWRTAVVIAAMLLLSSAAPMTVRLASWLAMPVISSSDVGNESTLRTPVEAIFSVNDAFRAGTGKFAGRGPKDKFAGLIMPAR
jgi:hypothetical protein